MLAQTGSSAGSLRGQVTDPSGAVVTGAAISVSTATGEIQKTVTDKSGNYFVRGLPAGNVTVSATAPGFTTYRMPNVIISAGQAQQLDIAFDIAVKAEQVTVQSESNAVDVSPENNASATVLKGTDLEALSDDPDELEQDLLALAGPSVGPNGGQIYIDGFSNGTLPPKSAIREVRINQNPFSAGYDRPGFGRIEVFTKPGTDKWHGQAMFNENNSVFNSRNPYVLSSVPPYHSEIYSGNVGGGLSSKVSTFLNAELRKIDETSAIDATTGFDTLTDTPVQTTAAVLAPRTRVNISPRIDWQVTPSNTLTARYQVLVNNQQNLGIGGVALQSQGYTSNETQQTLQASDTQMLSSHVINETRFQFIRDSTTFSANQAGAEINVLGEFTGGGNIFGQSQDTISRYELQNYTSWSVGKHFVKFGGRLRASADNSYSVANSNGTLIYSETTSSAGVPLSPLNNYLNGRPSQLSIVNPTVKNPRIQLGFADVGVYAEDDWKLRPNLTFSYGLRFESQSSISDKADFAPRLGLSWGLGRAQSAPKTVLRVGYGIFYDRFTEDLVLQSDRLNGDVEQQTIYTATAASPIVCPVGTNPPSAITAASCNLSGVPSSLTLYQINPNLHAPYTMQTAVSLERQLGPIGTVSVTYLNSRGIHQLDLENANAPDAANLRPLNAAYGDDNIYQYNSEAIFKQNQLVTNVQIRLSQKFSVNSFYALGYADSDTGGAASNPSNQYKLTQDYGRAPFDIRNRLFLSGTASLAHNIRISPFVIASSGAPFNITTGQDNNGDSFFNDRPTFATNPICVGAQTAGCDAQANVKSTQYGLLNVAAATNERLVPINYGKGPANVTVNMRLSKTFGFGGEAKSSGSPSSSQGAGGGGGGHGGPGGGGFGGPRGLANVFGPANTARRYNLTLTMTGRNIFNTWNPGSPVGNLASTMFGKTDSLAGGPFSSGTANRRVDFQAMFAF
jgi:hypothetical protein